MALTFITGPVRSGKSTFAARVAGLARKHVTYVATARVDPTDDEFARRIALHRQERPADWKTLETAGGAVDLTTLCASANASELLLIDSLGTWLADIMGTIDDASVETEDRLLARGRDLIASMQYSKCEIVVVSEETGWGIVPAHTSGRVFRDVLGRLNQELALVADRAYLCASGYALDLKKGAQVR